MMQPLPRKDASAARHVGVSTLYTLHKLSGGGTPPQWGWMLYVVVVNYDRSKAVFLWAVWWSGIRPEVLWLGAGKGESF